MLIVDTKLDIMNLSKYDTNPLTDALVLEVGHKYRISNTKNLVMNEFVVPVCCLVDTNTGDLIELPQYKLGKDAFTGRPFKVVRVVPKEMEYNGHKFVSYNYVLLGC